MNDKEGFSTTSFETTMVKNGFVVQATFASAAVGATNGIALDTDNLVFYDSVDAAIAADVTNIRLLKNHTENNQINVTDGKEITLDLNNKTLTMGVVETTNQYIYISNGTLNVTGKGTVVGKYTYLFRVLGTKELQGGVTKYSNLYIGENVTTKYEGEYYTIGVYGDFSSGDTYKKYSKGVNVVFKGTSISSSYFIHVNGRVSDKGTNSYDHPNILVEGATIDSISYLPGYADYTFKDNTFNITGSAFNIKSGNYKFTNNTFNISTNLPLVTPDYVAYSNGAFRENSTINFYHGQSGYAGIDQIEINADNKFIYSNETSGWNDILLYKEKTTDTINLTNNMGDSLSISNINAEQFTGSIKVTFHDIKKDSNSSALVYFIDSTKLPTYYLSKFLEEYSWVEKYYNNFAYQEAKIKNNLGVWETTTTPIEPTV